LEYEQMKKARKPEELPARTDFGGKCLIEDTAEMALA
jgi:hypothetical protein